MLGRLTPSRGRGIQFFPNGEGEWEKEFDVAKELGISHVEWVWDTPDNPLLKKEVREKVRARMVETGVTVRGVDVQFLTKIDALAVTDSDFNYVCESIADIHGEALEPPFLEGSSLLEKPERENQLFKLVELAKRYGLAVHVETDLPPQTCKELLSKNPELMVVYDSGNSHHFGYSVSEEWGAYGSRIRNVQVKDRPLGGSTVPLGEGGTDFRTLFKEMKRRGYNGPITLQAARGDDGKELETVKRYMEFVRKEYESV